ncbi:cytochrome c oxidase subunit I [Frigidibacter sp.]|uniref:cytochrome c oxidase subunit I n=1 Tax=Frigidibacter sp. TaxID=2586418 RepID=UPI002736AC45|nr:cytochrome c oxidase subunit I [Frigidibacter sp.]MDP3340187.1 cytochrome c oxidase subunit I [Frigidibacter sp.]
MTKAPSGTPETVESLLPGADRGPAPARPAAPGDGVTDPLALDAGLRKIWATGPGWQRFAAVNHSVVGVRFMITSLVFFTIGGILAMLIRVQLATPDSGFLEPGLYAQVFTMHGTVMMFLFAIPLFEGLAMYLLPKMLGARDMVFPRLSAYGYWCYLFGGTLLIVAMLAGAAPDGGWFMYTPLSSKPYSPGIGADVWLLGVTFVEISAISAAVEIMVTILILRAPGMSLDKMPVFAWYMLTVAAMMLVGFPPLILGSILLEAERAFGLPFFDPLRGGDPLLWQHLFWLFGHPEVYIIFLPAAGAISTLVPVFAGRPLAGYRAVVAALVAMAFLSFGLWVHHMYTTGLPHLSLALFSAASTLVAVPTAVQIFAWIATLAQRRRKPDPEARPKASVPMLHVFGFFFVFVMGGLTGVMLAIVPFDWQAHDTHFVVAHLHYVLIGGFLFPMLAAGYHWLPLISGRAHDGPAARLGFWLVFAGFNGTFFLMHITGLMGMPRRVHTYGAESGWHWLNLISSISSFVMAIGFAVIVIDLLLTLRFGRKAEPDPWQAATLEWAVPTLPPPPYNFAAIPRIDIRADRLEPRKMAPVMARGEGFLGVARNGWMETTGVTVARGEPDQIVMLPQQTFLPLWTAMATGVVFLSLLFKIYPLAIVAALVVVALFLRWPVGTHADADRGDLPAGEGVMLPLSSEAPVPPAVLALRVVAVADGALLASLLFGGLFLAISAPGWPPALWPELPMAPGVVAALALVVGWIAARMAVRGDVLRGAPMLGVALAANLATLAAMGWMIAALPPLQDHAAQAVLAAVMVWLGLHAFIGAVLAFNALRRLRTGHVSARRRIDIDLLRLWQAGLLPAGLVVLGFPVALKALALAALP